MNRRPTAGARIVSTREDHKRAIITRLVSSWVLTIRAARSAGSPLARKSLPAIEDSVLSPLLRYSCETVSLFELSYLRLA